MTYYQAETIIGLLKDLMLIGAGGFILLAVILVIVAGLK